MFRVAVTYKYVPYNESTLNKTNSGAFNFSTEIITGKSSPQ